MYLARGSSVLLSPGIETRAAGEPGRDAEERVRLRTSRAWGRFKRAAVSAFAFVEAAGPLYVGKLLRDGLGLKTPSRSDPAPMLDLPPGERIAAAEAVLRAMSLTEGFAPLVLVCGHGATVTNAPHASALHLQPRVLGPLLGHLLFHPQLLFVQRQQLHLLRPRL